MVPSASSNVIGKPRRRVDGRAKVTGQTRFADDLDASAHAALQAAALPAPARARSCRIDTSPRARAARRAPRPDRQGRSRSLRHPARDARTSTRSCPDKVRFVGDPVAAVRRRTSDRARGARPHRRGVRAAARRSPIPRRRCATREPRIHDYGDDGTSTRRSRSTSATWTRRWRAADHVFEDIFFYEGNTHLPIEQHAALAARGRRRQAHALVVHADAALRAPRAGQGAGHARRAHPRRSPAPTAAASAARATRSTTRSWSPSRR